MASPTFVKTNKNQLSGTRLPRSLSALETWGFGLTNLTVWLGTAPSINAALGPQAIFVWLPGIIVGILVNLQVKRLGEHWPDISGGTPAYTARLLRNYPRLGSYAAIAYTISWAALPPINAIILTDLIGDNLKPLGIACPETVLRIGFTLLAYVVAFSGTRALAILHLFFVLPAVGFLLVFCIQGFGWLALSPSSPGLFPSSWPNFSLTEWAKWYLLAGLFLGYANETAAAFVADSQQPKTTLRCLEFVSWLMPVVFLGGSWVVMRLATDPHLGNNTFLSLLAAASPFWGQSASFLVTLLIASSALLACATTVALCPRILYQLSLDRHLAPVFAVGSRQGVLGPSLVATFCISLLCLLWGDINQIILVTGTAWFAHFMLFHLSLWLQRHRPEVRWPWWSGGFFLVEAVVLAICGSAFGIQDVLIGLLLPIAFLAIDAAIRGVVFPPFHPQWWIQQYQKPVRQVKDFVMLQVAMLIVLVCGAAAISWAIRDNIEGIDNNATNNLLVVLLLTLAFVAIAIACWTSLPQVVAIDEAREHAETLFITALDTIPDTVLVLDENGAIGQANPAAFALFDMETVELMGRRLHNLLSGLPDRPAHWPSRSELTLNWSEQGTNEVQPYRIIEATLSQKSNHQLQEYIAILRDITDRKQSEESLRRSEAALRKQATVLEEALQDLQRTQAQLIQTEKMSSLGQLVAGVAHEINNPVNFIYGNLCHVGGYTQDLLSLIELYQRSYPNTISEISNLLEEIDLEFIIEDLPKTLSSMRVGADRIRQIVLTLRNFSRLDEADMKPVNIHEGIDSTLLILQHRLKAKPDRPAIDIVKEYGNLPEVECYAGQLNQVFMNILSNAIDALQDYDKERSLEEMNSHPSTITIATQVLQRGWVRISIKDNGPGIRNSIRKQLFDPFFTTKPVGEGTGLGLSISYQIVVDKHGGKIQCLSQSGQGAEFLIDIPIKQNSQTGRLNSQSQ